MVVATIKYVSLRMISRNAAWLGWRSRVDDRSRRLEVIGTLATKRGTSRDIGLLHRTK